MMKNIKLILFFVALLMVFGCNPPRKIENNKFSITGKILNSNGGDTIFLKKILDKDFLFVDSTLTASDGSFLLEGYTNGPEFYLLHTNNFKNQITLITDTSENIFITIDKKDFANNYAVDGSPNSKFICDIVKMVKNTRDISDSLGYIFRQNINAPNLEGIKLQLDSVYFSAENNLKQFAKDFIDNNTSSLACIIYLSQYIAPKNPVFDTQKDFDYYNKVAIELNNIYPDNFHVQKLIKFVDNIKSNTKISNPYNILEEGQIAPDIRLKNINGDSVSLSKFKGKYVFIDFWASWSPVSVKNNSNLVKCYWKYYNSNFTIFQVSLDNKFDSWKDAIKTQKLSWTNVSDLKLWDSKPVKDYGVAQLPYGVLIDPNGKIIKIGVQAEDLDQLLHSIIGKPRALSSTQNQKNN
ncbi:MAG: AhpC/TSA family protein [Bacteroidales bacterium]|nr:AhpC/TSA family protein [Bacteroidales bacterium]